MKLNYQPFISYYYDISIALSLIAINFTLQLIGDLLTIILINHERIITFDAQYENRY